MGNVETQPNTDTLKLLSQEYSFSINTLLGSPRHLYCQCSGMPFNDDDMISHEHDGSYNEDYCKWCYSYGYFTYNSKASLIDFLIVHMPNPDDIPENEHRIQYNAYLSNLKHWK